MKATGIISKCMAVIMVAAGFAVATGEIASAATITYVGTQVDIESNFNDPANGWRNVSPLKPLDIDGDNILGTDGYKLKNVGSNPSYATVTVVAPNANNNTEGKVWDTPSNPSGADTIMAGAFHDNAAGSGVTTVPLLRFVISGTDLDGKTLRLGVLHDIQCAGTNTATYTVSQTNSLATVTTPVLPWDGAALDVSFFDIKEAVAGDTFDITATTISTTFYPNAFEQVAGITFDSIVPPPPAGTVVVIK